MFSPYVVSIFDHYITTDVLSHPYKKVYNTYIMCTILGVHDANLLIPDQLYPLYAKNERMRNKK